MMNTPQALIVKSDATGERLDRWIATALEVTRSQAERKIDGGAVLVNGKRPKKAGDRVREGDVVVVNGHQAGDESSHQNATDSLSDDVTGRGSVSFNDGSTQIQVRSEEEVKVVAETENYIIVIKPAGLIVHPSAQSVTLGAVNASQTLAGWVLVHYPEIWGVGEYSNRPGLPHRLDRETSGLMVIAKNQTMFDALKAQFKGRQIEKKYWTLVYGEAESDYGAIDFPIGRRADGRMAARPVIRTVTLKNVKALQPGREAVTEFSVAERFHGYTLLDVTLHTGRTHQIRVHLFAYNHPVVGDKLYWQKKLKSGKGLALHRLFLHAHRLCFTDLSGARVCFDSPLPEELIKFLGQLKKK